jgi:hypothetical protein
MPELPLDDRQGDPFVRHPIAWACRSGCGAKRRRTPAWAASRRNSPRAAVADQPRPPGRSGEDAEQRTDRQLDAVRGRASDMLSASLVHPDYPSLATFAHAEQHRPGPYPDQTRSAHALR